VKTRPFFFFALLATILLGLFVYFDIDLVPVDSVDRGSEDVRRNPLLAASLLLQQEGFVVSSKPSLTAMPVGAGTIIMRQSASSLSPAEAKQLADWVDAGNELITEAPPEWTGQRGVPDPILDPLGVRLKSWEPSPPVFGKKRAAGPPGGSFAKIPDSNLSWIEVSPKEGWLQLGFLPSRYLEDTRHTATGWLQGTHGMQALQYKFGKGQVIVLSDSYLFENGSIGDGDNAALLLRLVESPQGSHVWIFFDRSFPPLTTLLWTHARPAVIGVLVFAACWLWWIGRRFGPLLPALFVPRRRLSEHLHAAGRYLWYAGEEKRLYKVMRQNLRQRLLRRHSEWRQLSADDLVQLLATQSQLPAGQIQQALFGNVTADTGRFLNDMRVLSTLSRM
jgi:hypothetical protein